MARFLQDILFCLGFFDLYAVSSEMHCKRVLLLYLDYHSRVIPTCFPPLYFNWPYFSLLVLIRFCYWPSVAHTSIIHFQYTSSDLYPRHLRFCPFTSRVFLLLPAPYPSLVLLSVS